MKKILLLLVLLLCFSCNDNPEANLPEFIENKPWIEDDLMGIPVFYQQGMEYIMFPKDHTKLKNKRLDLYLADDSPDNPKENSRWIKTNYYKISKDTLFLEDMDDGDIHVRRVKILKDTTIGILDYHLIEMTALRREGNSYQKGLTYKMISKK